MCLPGRESRRSGAWYAMASAPVAGPPAPFRRWSRLRVILRLLLPWLLAWGLAAFPPQAAAQPGDIEARTAAWAETLDQVAITLSEGGASEADYAKARETLMGIAADARRAAGASRGTLEITRQMLAALGEPPGADTPPESGDIAAERQRLAESAAAFDARIRQAELVGTRAEILLKSMAAQRFDRFARSLVQPDPAILDPATYAGIEPQLRFFTGRLLRPLLFPEDTSGLGGDSLARAVAIAAVVVLAGWWLRRWLLHRFGQRSETGEPPLWRRLGSGLAETVSRGVLPSVAIAAVAIVAIGWLGPSVASQTAVAAVARLAIAAILYLLLSAVTRAILAPDMPAWRLVPIVDGSARPLARRLRILAAVLAGAAALIGFVDAILIPVELRSIVTAAALIAGSVATLQALPGRLWIRRSAAPPPVPAGAEDLPPQPRGAWARPRLVIGLVAVCVALAALFGYLSLSLYVARLALAIAAVAAFGLVLRGIGRELIGLFVRQPLGLMARMRRAALPDERGLRIFETGMSLLADLAVMLVGLAIVLPVAGLSGAEMADIGAAILRGVTIGGITIAPGDILAGILTVAVGVMLTRLFQRRLDASLLDRMQIDQGLRNSIRTGIGYLGFILAGLLGIGVLGLDLTKLAIIAGALSVGIGFGLQNIVSNFVAGLILLVERPVKVGDWIVVGGAEGLVRRISVRATEIQTFQRASVIVPNSDLIAGAVVNKTHKNRFARIDIPVGIDYDSDPEAARDILLNCARADTRISAYPGPLVIFKDFGPHALQLELQCFVSDVDDLGAGTDLRFVIWRALKAAGIVVAFPQQRLHLAEIEPLLAALRQDRATAPPAEG
jgi:potassium efflux system protein